MKGKPIPFVGASPIFTKIWINAWNVIKKPIVYDRYEANWRLFLDDIIANLIILKKIMTNSKIIIKEKIRPNSSAISANIKSL